MPFGQYVHGEVDVVAVANTTYTITFYDVNGNVRALLPTERIVVNSISISDNASGSCVVFFDTNANGTPEAGEEAVASINPNTFPTGYNPALVGPVGAALKARPSLAGQLYVEVIGRIVDQNTPV